MFLLSWLIVLFTITQSSFGQNVVIKNAEQWLAHTAPSKLASQHSVVFRAASYQSIPQRKPNAPDPGIAAHSALIYDVSSGQYLYHKNDGQQVPMASLTKLMTALVIMQRHKPDEIVTIPDGLPQLGSADEALGFQPGEKFTVANMLQALLVQSANDAANALAVWDSGSIDAFAVQMNAYANQWGLSNSHFVDANGLDTPNHYSSAQDLQKLSSVLLNSKDFRTIVNTQKATITDQAGKSYALATTNQDLSLPYAYGIKTGFTDNAGQSLILLGRKDGHELITVVLNSPDRFQESKNMLDWAFNNYIWK